MTFEFVGVSNPACPTTHPTHPPKHTHTAPNKGSCCSETAGSVIPNPPPQTMGDFTRNKSSARVTSVCGRKTQKAPATPFHLLPSFLLVAGFFVSRPKERMNESMGARLARAPPDLSRFPSRGHGRPLPIAWLPLGVRCSHPNPPSLPSTSQPVQPSIYGLGPRRRFAIVAL